MFKAPKPQSLEIYLSQIERELRALPSQARADELREIESHLRALVLASQQLENLSQAQATAVGLRQFGSPRAIGRNLRKAWERKQPEAWWRILLTPMVGIASYISLVQIFTAATAMTTMNGIFYSWNLYVAIQYLNSHPTEMVFNVLLYFFVTATTCALTGFGIGVVSPKYGHGVVFAWLAFAFWVVYTALASDPYVAIEFERLFLGFHVLCGAFYLYGAHLGARFSRKHAARIANAQ